MLDDRTRLKKLKTASCQIIIILAVWGCAYVLQKLLNLPVASGVLGFFLLLFLLEMKWLKLAHVERGAELLLAELLLFFMCSATLQKSFFSIKGLIEQLC